MAENVCPHCGERHKKRTVEEQKALLTRLRKAEGQIRGIEKMVENDAWCPDILIQVSAVTNALNSFNKELLACHIKSCVSEDIRKSCRRRRSDPSWHWRRSRTWHRWQ